MLPVTDHTLALPTPNQSVQGYFSFMANPKISVLVLASNGKWLDTCIASVLRQRLQDFELIIGSSSQTDEIETTVSRWRNPRIQIFKATAPLGIAQMRQQLLALARGRFIKLLSHRDFLYENSLQELATAMEETGAPVAFHNWRIVDQHGILLDRSNSFPTGFTEVPRELLTRYVVARRDNFVGSGTNMLFNREIATRQPAIFGVDEFELSHLGELALCVHLSSSQSLVGVGGIGAASRRTHSGPMDGTRGPSSKEQIEWEILQRWCLDQGHIKQSEIQNMAGPDTEFHRSNRISLPAEGPFLSQSFKQTVAKLLAGELQE
jgi:hypothetical protein